jgi:hypothetical protein
MIRARYGLLGVGLLAFLAGCSAVPATPAPVPSPYVPAFTPAPPRADLAAVFGDGTHEVPIDVAPGTYRTINYSESCYWVRFSGFSGGLSDWISSGIGPGYHVVTIGPDDAGFDSRDCGDWTDEIVQVTDSMSHIGEGTYLVGTDMAPGIWRAENGPNCYWARLSGFGGTEQELLEESLTTDGAAPEVTISATDVGFTSNGCGSWMLDAP